MSSNLPSPEALLAAPDATRWLKTALIGAMARDPVKAAKDAELLASVLAARADEILERHMAAAGGVTPQQCSSD